MKKIKLIFIIIGLAVLAVTAMALFQVYEDSGEEARTGREKSTPQIIEVKDIAVVPDPEQKKIIDNLKATLDTIIEENRKLSEKEKSYLNQIERLKAEVSNKDNRINFLTSLNARLETSVDRMEDNYEEEIGTVKKEKEDLGGLLENERLARKKSQQEASDQIDMLVRDLRIAQKKIGEILAKNRKDKLLRETAKMHYNLGNVFVEVNEHIKAIREYNRSLELYSEDPDVHYNLAVVYDVYARDLISALRHYKKCLELNPDHKGRQSIEERILYLELKETVSISPTLSSHNEDHPFNIDRIDTSEVFDK